MADVTFIKEVLCPACKNKVSKTPFKKGFKTGL